MKDSPIQAARAQHASLVTVPTLDASSGNEIAWYETLRELQANIADLKTARARAFRYSKLSRVTARGFFSRNAEDSENEVRVLEELVLAGMHQ